MSFDDKLRATEAELLIEEANAEIEELSDHSRPMVVENINEA